MERVKQSILVVDDETYMRELFSCLLLDYGHEVVTAAGPAEAREALVGRRFDIAFVDHYLGSTLGLDLIREMRETDPGLSCIMMTGSGTTDLAVEALQEGAVDFIEKPFFEEDVLGSIDQVLKRKARDEQRRQSLRELEERVAEKTAQLIDVNFAVLTTLARAVEKRDLGTYGHSMRVGEIAELIAERMGLSAGQRDDLRAAAMLHDIGKIGISDTILGKPGPLSREELATVRKHPENGVEILGPLQHYGTILPAIGAHHERFDGTGYPRGMQGYDIPLLARIIAVADTYDAILSDRPYRRAAGHGQGVAEIRKMSGKQFDPVVVSAFLDVFETETPARLYASDDRRSRPISAGDDPGMSPAA